MKTLNLAFLGGFDVRLAGTLITAFASDKDRALLAYLAVESEKPLWRENLAGLFWPETSEKQARHSLSQALYSLKTLLKDETNWTPLDLTPKTVQFHLDEHGWVDVHQINQLVLGCKRHQPEPQPVCPACLGRQEQAIDLYRGEFLAGLVLPDCEAFEDWLRLQRTGLCQKIIRAEGWLAQAFKALGSPDQAILHARRQVALDPLDEAGHRQVMRLLAEHGQRAEALAQYAACRKILAGELNVEPDAETNGLYQTILQQTGGHIQSKSIRNNLPASLTPLIGRQMALEKIISQLTQSGCRLLTLLGPGGSGKTRLAVEAGRSLLPAFPDGVYLIELDTRQSAQALLPAIARVIGLDLHLNLQSKESGPPFPPEAEIHDQVLDHLRGKKLLLILDGCEAILDQAGEVAHLLRHAPQVQVLATSRARLYLQGEAIFLVEGLAYPIDEIVDDDFHAFGALQLFLEAARQSEPGFELTRQNRQAVVDICRLSQGLPLGILMAAAWTNTISPETIFHEIQRGLDIMTSVWQDLPERQRSLRATFDHSWRLLGQPERSIFIRLSVFRGAFTAEHARLVADASYPMLKTLIDQSLLQPQGSGRYRMHDLLRQYAQEKLAAFPIEHSAAYNRHSQMFMLALQTWEHRLKSSEQYAALDEIDLLHADILAAWDWSVEDDRLTMIEAGAEALGRYYFLHGWYAEGVATFQKAVDRIHKQGISGQNLLAWARLSNQLAEFLARAYEFDQAILALQPVVQALQNNDELTPALLREQAMAWIVMGDLFYIRHRDMLQAMKFYRQALPQMRSDGSPWDIAFCLVKNADCEMRIENYRKARSLALEAQEIGRPLGDPSLDVFILMTLGPLCMLLGEHEEAYCMLDGLRDYSEHIHTHYDQVSYWNYLLWILGWTGHWVEARQICMMAADLYRKSGEFFSNYGATFSVLYGLDLHEGNYEAVRNISAAKVFNITNPRQYVTGNVGGMIYILDEKYDEAAVEMAKWLDFCRDYTWPGQTGATFAFLGLIAYKKGQPEKVRPYLIAAFENYIQYECYFHFCVTFAVMALILAEQGEIEQAVALYATATIHPMAGKSRFFEDLFGKHIADMAKGLSEEAIQAARALGRSRDPYATAQENLTRLCDPSIPFLRQ